MQRPAKPFTPVRFRLQPPIILIMHNTENQENSPTLDLNALAKDLYRNSKYILLSTVCFAIVGIVISFGLPKEYTSESLLSTVSSSDSRGSSDIASQYGSLASAVGIDIGSAMGGQKDLAIKTIQSRDFLKFLLSNPEIFQVFVAAEKYNKTSKELMLNKELIKRYQSFLSGESELNFKDMNPSFDVLYAQYLRMLSISSQTESNFIKLSVTHISPDFAQFLLTEIISQLNLKAKNADLRKSNRAIEFLTSTIQETQIQEVRSTMSALLENQLKTQLMANILDEYLLSTLDRPHNPRFPSSMSRKNIVVIFTILGFVLSILYFMIREYLRRAKL
jgi:uncharacterized protein involved in exopolysaccharide biosynthesis